MTLTLEFDAKEEVNFFTESNFGNVRGKFILEFQFNLRALEKNKKPSTYKPR